MDSLLSIKNLTKNYNSKEVLKGIDIELPTGNIVGLLGPNGSGKTTLLRIIAGLEKRYNGDIQINSNNIGVQSKAIVSYMPDQSFIYKFMRVKDAIKWFSDYFPDFDLQKAEELRQFFDLNPKDKVKNLSKGNIEKCMLLLTLSRRAKLYLLDEPLGGIDPLAKVKIINSIIDNFSVEDSSIIISTHLLKDTEKLFDYAMFLKDGKIIKHGNADDIRQESNKTLEEVYVSIYDNGGM
jgi:ABC-2 type transport system ATP-binding protein